MLCDKSVKTGAMVKNEYTRIEEEEAIYYEYQYYFEVGEETYSGTHRVSKELKIPIVEIFYNSDDPNNVTIHDPCIDYNKLKDRPMRYPDWIEYLGMGIILLGLGFGRSSIVRAIKGNND